MFKFLIEPLFILEKENNVNNAKTSYHVKALFLSFSFYVLWIWYVKYSKAQFKTFFSSFFFFADSKVIWNSHKKYLGVGLLVKYTGRLVLGWAFLWNFYEGSVQLFSFSPFRGRAKIMSHVLLHIEAKFLP